MKWQGQYDKRVNSLRDSAAGSVAATIELVVCLLDGIRKFKEGVPRSVISVHVYDIYIARLSKDRQEVLDDMGKARDIMNKEFIQDRALCFARKKRSPWPRKIASHPKSPSSLGRALNRRDQPGDSQLTMPIAKRAESNSRLGPAGSQRAPNG